MPDYRLLPKGRAINGTVGYANICGMQGALISNGLATLNELQTIYSLEDAYLLFEIISVNRYNDRIISDGNRHR